ncbi:hypothetical protein BC830DRAFT_800643 [Chytriomyces sp. MP71]|nr:hypothetical protein BC830DRAFT_800643 [Chytriomyces sp. MP71]
MRDGQSLKLRVANFNLLNFHEAGAPFYHYTQGLSSEQVEAKVEWTAQQLRRMNAGIVAFQEIFSLVPLTEAATRAGYNMQSTQIVAPAVDGRFPAVGLLSVYPILEVQSFASFPPDFKINLAADSGGPAVYLPLSHFSRPVLRVLLEIDTGHKLAVFVTHLKSKRPVIAEKGLGKDLKANAIGQAISLTIRAAEAAALRCILLDELGGDQEVLRDLATYSTTRTEELTKQKVAYVAPSHAKRVPDAEPLGDRKHPQHHQRKLSVDLDVSSSLPASRGRHLETQETVSDSARPVSTAGLTNGGKKQYPTIVMGDLNDVTHAVSTEILSGSPPFKRLPFWEKELLWRTLLYSAHDVQARAADRDVNYTYIHNGRYECLDNILVSNALVRSNASHIGYVQWVQCFNDHLIDQALAEDDDDEDSPLTLPRAPAHTHAGSTATHYAAHSPHASAESETPNSPRYRPAKLSGRDVTRSDHGQVVALLKIFPKHLGPQSEYARELMVAGLEHGHDGISAKVARVVRYGADGMAEKEDGEGVNEDIPERLRSHPGHHRNQLDNAKSTEDEKLDADEVASVFYAHNGDAAGRAIKAKLPAQF